MKMTLTSNSSSDFKNGSCGQASAKQLWWALAFFGSLAAATLGLRHLPLPFAVRSFVPAVPLVAGLMYLLTMVRDLRHQVDEMQLRIYLEAAAVVVCGLFIIMLTYPTFQEAGVLPALDYSMVLTLIVLLGTGGYLSARRRYR
jgi:cation transport ATPase